MPGNKYATICNPKQYRALRRAGYSKEQAARISNGQSCKAAGVLSVFKDAKGRDRWLSVTTTAYQDQDKEWISRKAIAGVVAKGDATGKRGVLRFWHVPGADFGECDYQATAQDGRFLVESGTCYSPAHAAVVKEAARRGYQMSPGFTHPVHQPGVARVYEDIEPFERSFVPKGRASNPYTRLAMTGASMLTKEKREELISLGAPAGLVDQLSAAIVATDKAAQAQSTYKSTDTPSVYALPDGTPAIIQDGRLVALKALGVPAAVETKAPMPPAEMMAAAATEEADAMQREAEAVAEVTDESDLADLTVGQFKALLGAALDELAGGYSSKMADLKSQYEAMGKAFGAMQQTKDDTRAQIDQLKTIAASGAKLAADVDKRLKELEGDTAPVIKQPVITTGLDGGLPVPAGTMTYKAPAGDPVLAAADQWVHGE